MLGRLSSLNINSQTELIIVGMRKKPSGANIVRI